MSILEKINIMVKSAQVRRLQAGGLRNGGYKDLSASSARRRSTHSAHETASGDRRGFGGTGTGVNASTNNTVSSAAAGRSSAAPMYPVRARGGAMPTYQRPSSPSAPMSDDQFRREALKMFKPLQQERGMYSDQGQSHINSLARDVSAQLKLMQQSPNMTDSQKRALLQSWKRRIDGLSGYKRNPQAQGQITSRKVDFERQKVESPTFKNITGRDYTLNEKVSPEVYNMRKEYADLMSNTGGNGHLTPEQQEERREKLLDYNMKYSLPGTRREGNDVVRHAPASTVESNYLNGGAPKPYANGGYRQRALNEQQEKAILDLEDKRQIAKSTPAQESSWWRFW